VHRRLILAALGLLAAACTTRYVNPPAPGRSDLHIAVFTGDDDEGEAVLEWLEERGFDNEANHLARPNDEEPGIYWGAAPTRLVNEIAAYLEGRYGVELEREREFDRLDPAVHVHLPSAARGAAPERGELRVVVFTDDRERGERFLEHLASELGYDNDENYVTDSPNEDFNIKWGAATGEMVDEIVAAADEQLDVELDRQRVFEADDRDVFINLPLGGKVGTERSDFEVTLFCDDTARARRFLERLGRLGYTHDENEVLDGPNEDFNIKYGGLPEEFVEELAVQVESVFGTRPRTRREFDRTSDQVFINLPARR
jgi:hypothetical protein